MIETGTRRPEVRTVENILYISASGKLTATDYETLFMPAIDAHIKQFGKARIVLEFAVDFDGWEAAAMLDDMKIGLQHWRDFHRIALIGPPAWVAVFAHGLSLVSPGECRSFDRDEIDTAWDWVKS